MSTAPATASSSSSQSSRDSWQPSQEENFQTASLGLRAGAAMSDLPHAEDRAELLVGEHRAVAADEGRAELAVAAEADGAFHVALHRDVHRARSARPRRRARRSEKRIITSGPQTRATVCAGSKAARGMSVGHHADVAVPVAAGMIDRDGEIDVEPPPPALELVLEEDVVRLRAAEEEHEPAVARRARRGSGRSPGAAARGRGRRRRSPRRCRPPPRPASRGRRARARRPGRRASAASAPRRRGRRRGWCGPAAPRSAGSPLIEIATSPTPKA